MKLHTHNGWEYWYDPHVRVWYAQPEGAAPGDVCVHSGTREGIVAAIDSEQNIDENISSDA